MKRKAFIIPAILSLFFVLCVSVGASEPVQLYNRGEKIVTGHEIVRCGEEYFISTQDLGKLGLEYEFSAEKKLGGQYSSDYKNVHTITSRDCLGVWYSADIAESEKYTDVIVGKDGNLQPVEYAESYADSGAELNEAFAYTKARAKESVGTNSDGDFADLDVSGNSVFKYLNAYVYVGEECYISLSFIGQYLSHSYAADGDRIELWTSNENYLTVEVVADLNGCADKGANVSLCIARSVGETLADCDVIGKAACVVSDKKTADKALIEVPSGEAGDGNLYFAADFGEKYTLLSKRLNFLQYGKLTAYAERETIDFTANISLPEIDAEDVDFVLYAAAGKTEKSVRESIKSGELNCSVRLEGLPAESDCKAWIIFDTYKYKSEYIYDDGLVLRTDGKYKSDISADYTAKVAKKIVCTISLPEGYDCNGNDIPVRLEIVNAVTSAAVSDGLKSGSDSAEVILNDAVRSATVPLYFNLLNVRLRYTVVNDTDGLVKSGYYNSPKTVESELGGEILSTGQTASMSLLKYRDIKLTVSRPYENNNDSDILGKVYVMRGNVSEIYDIIDFDESNPLIRAGERNGVTSIRVVENDSYFLKITGITGDEYIYPEYRYVYTGESILADKYIAITTDTQKINISLLRCINITGTVICDDSIPACEAAAECKDCFGNTGTVDAVMDGYSFNLKIPEGTKQFRIYAKTLKNVNSYYIADGRSTREHGEAKVFTYDKNDINGLEIKYDTYMPDYPIEVEISPIFERVTIRNKGDLPLAGSDIYIAAYDRNNRLMSLEKSSMTDSYTDAVYYCVDSYKAKYMRIMVWQKDSTKPLGRIYEFTVNGPVPNDIEGFSFTDITEENKYYDAVMDTYACGIFLGYEDGSFKPDVLVYRSEAALTCCKVMGYYYSKYDFSCKDVEENHWAHSYIGICVNENVFDLEDGYFRPMEYITVNEAVQSAVRVMGFGAEDYIEKAHELNITDNIELTDGDRFITRGEYTQLIYNVMNNK